jgi:uncharacterized tellurite resistance protein B-like protein
MDEIDKELIIDASIKMMLIDSIIDEREFKKIKEMCAELLITPPADSELRERIAFISEHEIMSPVSEVAHIISESLSKEDPRKYATKWLAKVMISDGRKAKKEVELVQSLAKLWGTSETLQEELSDN